MKLSECTYGKLVVTEMQRMGDETPQEYIGMIVGITEGFIGESYEPMPLVQWSYDVGNPRARYHHLLSPYEE